MHRSSRRTRGARGFLAVVLVALSVLAGAGPATAAQRDPVDDSGYTAEQKAAAQQTAAQKTAQQTCDLLSSVGLPSSLEGKCESALSSQFTTTTVPSLAAAGLCTAVTVAVPPLGVACAVLLATHVDQVRGWFWDAYGAALKGAAAAVQVAGTAVAFIANPQRAYDFFVNDTKSDSLSLFQGVMGEVTSTTGFDASAQWWRDAYAATGGIGLGLLVVSLLVASRQFSEGRIGPAEMSRVWGNWLMVAVLMMVFGPPVAWVLGQVAAAMSEGLIAWMGPDTVNFLQRGAVFTSMQASMAGGPLAGLVIFGLLFVGLLGILGTFVAQTISVYLLGASAGAAWGLSVHPRWRNRALAVPVTAAVLIFARPATLLALGLASKMANALTDTSATTGIQPLVNALIVIFAIVMVAFTPWVLLRWMPVGMDAADSVRSSGPVGTEAAIGLAGSTASSLAMMRARSDSSTGGGTRGGGSTTSRTATVVPPGASGGGGSQVVVRPAGGGGGGAAAKTAGAAGSTAKAGQTAGTAGRAAGAAGSAGGAAGGAATGGALLAAHLAAQAAQAAVRKAKDSAEAGVPSVREA